MICVTSWRRAKTRRVVSAALCAVLVVIGISMIYLGSHWAGDVVVGWAMGAGIGYVSGRLLRPRDPSPAAPDITYRRDPPCTPAPASCGER